MSKLRTAEEKLSKMPQKSDLVNIVKDIINEVELYERKTQSKKEKLNVKLNNLKRLKEQLKKDNVELNINQNKNEDIDDDPIYRLLMKLGHEIVSNKKKAFKSFTMNIELYKNELSKERFDIRHILFAIGVAAESNIALPQKIDLITNAYFDGVKRFTLKPSKYVVEFKEEEEINRLSEYLLNKGVERKSICLITTRFGSIVNFFKETGSSLKLAKTNKVIKTRAEKVLEEALIKLNKTMPQKMVGYFLLEDYLRSYGDNTYSDKMDLNRYLFWNFKYKADAKPSHYLQYPELWPWEFKLDQAKDDLRQLLVNLYHTSYPGVPDAERVKDEFMKKKEHLEAIIYQWLRDLWVYIEKNRLLDEDNKPRKKAAKVLIQHLLDEHPYLTRDSQLHLIQNFTDSNNNIYTWMDSIFRSQHVMDQLSANLLDNLYQPLFDSIAKLGKIERQPVPFKSIKKEDFYSFGHWAKPKIQKNIQIVDMLPSSRDDLVSMSINEGGMTAQIAAKAEGAATYDINKLKTVMQIAERSRQLLWKDGSSTTEKEMRGIDTLSESLRERQQLAKNQKFEEMLDMSRAGSLGGYSLGASAKGSIYGRAKAALAYSRRREYLDAAITAAGRGDNFAKWVVRKSDIRSELAETDQKKLVAAAHNGYPNGDQPFHLLVKIPHKSVHTEWDGTQYILFNSSYVATRKVSWWKKIGTVGFAAKLPLLLINPRWYSKVEESAVGTVYPFKWDIKARDRKGQEKLLREPNILGGRIILDDTDKINYSEVSTLIEAEANFIQQTRTDQSDDLGRVLGEIKKEAGDEDFRKKIRDGIKADNDLTPIFTGIEIITIIP